MINGKWLKAAIRRGQKQAFSKWLYLSLKLLFLLCDYYVQKRRSYLFFVSERNAMKFRESISRQSKQKKLPISKCKYSIFYKWVAVLKAGWLSVLSSNEMAGENGYSLFWLCLIQATGRGYCVCWLMPATLTTFLPDSTSCLSLSCKYRLICSASAGLDYSFSAVTGRPPSQRLHVTSAGGSLQALSQWCRVPADASPGSDHFLELRIINEKMPFQ